MSKYVFFRLDDIGIDLDKFQYLKDLLITNCIPFSLQLIPTMINQSWKNEILSLNKSAIDLEICQHGFKHFNYGNKCRIEYEFGPVRSYAEQYNDILKGKTLLGQYFKKNLKKIFTPPFNNFNSDTLKVLEKLNYEVLSQDGKKIFHDNNLNDISATIDIISNYELVLYKNVGELISEIEVIDKEFVGVQIHHNYLTASGLKLIQNLIIWLKSNSYNFTLIHQIHESSKT